MTFAISYCIRLCSNIRFLWLRNIPHLFTLKFLCFIASVIKNSFNATASLSLPHLIGSRLVISLGENILLIKGVVFGLTILVVFITHFILGYQLPLPTSSCHDGLKQLSILSLQHFINRYPFVLLF